MSVEDSASTAPFRRTLPALEPETRAFWTGGAEGLLMIAHCDDCGRYQHPPAPYCPKCGGALRPAQVSGRARVAAFTINQQVWTRGLETPFVFAAVDLVEQAELHVLTNIVGCPPEAVWIGMPVEVVFEQHGDVFLPLFRPCEDAHAG